MHPNITNELFIITSGLVVPNPSEMLSSKKFKDLIASLRTHFDIIILDGPPVLPVPDSIPIGLAADGTLFVIASEQTEKEAAQIAVTTLRRSNVNVIGSVLTMVKKESSSYQYSYQAYRHEKEKTSLFSKKRNKID
jgi:capsular exopolysaccharide synthesis family protein